MPSFDVYYGVSILKPRSHVADVGGRQQGKTMKLSEAIKKGIVKSAWGDNDTPDYVGLNQRDGTVAERQEAEAERVRKRILDEALKARDAELAREQAEAELVRERTAAVIEEMEAIAGFGSF